MGFEGVATVVELLACGCGSASGGHLLAMLEETLVLGAGIGGGAELFSELFKESEPSRDLEGSVGVDILSVTKIGNCLQSCASLHCLQTEQASYKLAL